MRRAIMSKNGGGGGNTYIVIQRDNSGGLSNFLVINKATKQLVTNVFPFANSLTAAVTVGTHLFDGRYYYIFGRTPTNGTNIVTIVDTLLGTFTTNGSFDPAGDYSQVYHAAYDGGDYVYLVCSNTGQVKKFSLSARAIVGTYTSGITTLRNSYYAGGKLFIGVQTSDITKAVLVFNPATSQFSYITGIAPTGTTRTDAYPRLYNGNVMFNMIGSNVLKGLDPQSYAVTSYGYGGLSSYGLQIIDGKTINNATIRTISPNEGYTSLTGASATINTNVLSDDKLYVCGLANANGGFNVFDRATLTKETDWPFVSETCYNCLEITL